VYDLASGDRWRIERALRDFHARGRLLTEEDRESIRLTLVSDWGRDSTALEEKLVLTSVNAEARALNGMIQELRREAGELGDVFAEVAGERIYLGDRVLFTRRQKAYGGRDAIENGMLGTVEAFDPVRNLITVRVDGKEDGRTVSVDLFEYQSLRLGYAVTTHKAQGATVDSSYILLGSRMTDAQAAYVQVSRHREHCRLYVSRDDAGEDFEDLITDMSRDRRKRLAHDEARAPPEQKLRVSRREWWVPQQSRGISIELRP
jgi:ATP-dependent exoDNAse (exonuclease V) alpha subunit